MDIELEPLGTLTISVGETTRIPDTPHGRRVIVEFTAVRWESPRVRAELRGRAAADWLTVGPEGTATFDIRITLVTDDGAFVYVEMEGRNDSRGFATNAPVFLAVRFEAGDPRYAWLNLVQAIAKGSLADGEVVLTMAALR